MKKISIWLLTLFWFGLVGGTLFSQTSGPTGGCFTPVYSADTLSVTCPEDSLGWLTVDPGTTTGPFTFSWSTGDTTDTIYNVPQGIINVTITDSAGCTETFSVNSQVIAPWIVNAQLGSSACSNNAGSIDLTVNSGPGGYSYQWSNGATTEDITGLSAGFYSVTITSAQGCLFFENFNVSGGPPQVDLGPRNQDVCNTSVNLDAGAGFFAYLWSNGASTQNIVVNTNGTYYVDVWDQGGCVGSDTVTINFLTPANISIAGSNPYEICDGETAYLNAIDPSIFAYVWSTGQTSGDISVVTGGLYSVIGTAGNGCTDTAEVTVVVHQNPAVSLGPDTGYCTNSTVTVSPGAGYASYLWSTNETTASIQIGIQGGYWVMATDSNGCSGRDTIIIDHYFLPNPVIAGDTTYCVGTPFTLDAGAGYIAYNWNLGDITQVIVPDQSGPYQVVVQDSNGCFGGSNTSIITILPLPAEPVITFQGSNLVSTPASSYQWYYEYNLIPGATAQTYRPTEPGNYLVQVTDANNCGNTLSSPFLVVFNITEEHVPQGFSPNGDGIHDQLVIKFIEFFPGNQLSIMNRWGQQVYQEKNYANTWSGVSDTGKDLPDGTYFYVLTFDDNSIEPVSGYIIINR